MTPLHPKQALSLPAIDQSRDTISPLTVYASPYRRIHSERPFHQKLSLSVPAIDLHRDTISPKNIPVSRRRIHPGTTFHHKLLFLSPCNGSLQGHHFTTNCLSLQEDPLQAHHSTTSCLCIFLQWINPGTTFHHKKVSVSSCRRIHPGVQCQHKLSLSLIAGQSIQGHHFTTNSLCPSLLLIHLGT